MKGHGTRACYDRGCRQPECIEAARLYKEEYDYRRGTREPTVDASRVRNVLIYYWELGYKDKEMGRQLGVPFQSLWKIRTGRRKMIRHCTWTKLERAFDELGVEL